MTKHEEEKVKRRNARIVLRWVTKHEEEKVKRRNSRIVLRWVTDGKECKIPSLVINRKKQMKPWLFGFCRNGNESQGCFPDLINIFSVKIFYFSI